MTNPPEYKRRPLSYAECRVLVLKLRGFTNREISERLHISFYTVKSHLRRSAEAMGVPGSRGPYTALHRGFLVWNPYRGVVQVSKHVAGIRPYLDGDL